MYWYTYVKVIFQINLCEGSFNFSVIENFSIYSVIHYQNQIIWTKKSS